VDHFVERCGPIGSMGTYMLCRWPSTIWDVARVAGVSVSTVSKALNGRGQLREETRSLVQSAAERLNFRPNNLAQSLLVASIWRASGGFGLLT
jgi:DNA-binding LacI/PurR family transcriptional regulator